MAFTSQGLFGEQLRHLLSLHNNSLTLDLLPTLYLSEFHRPEDPDIYEWLKTPLKHAPHIVHLAAEGLLVWAPTGRPYPRTRNHRWSLEAPDHLRANVDELGSVPEELYRYQQMVEEPLPSISIDELLDTETISLLLSNKETPIETNEENIKEEEKEKEEKKEEEEEEVKTKSYQVEESIGFMTIDSKFGDTTPILGSTLDKVQTNGCTLPTTAAITGDHSPLPPSLGLEYGQFAGLMPQSVAQLMRESLNKLPEDDTQGRVKAMAPFIEYFGELSARELERVDGPPKSRTKGRGKRSLAIRFPNQSTTTDTPPSVTTTSSHNESSDSSDA